MRFVLRYFYAIEIPGVINTLVVDSRRGLCVARERARGHRGDGCVPSDNGNMLVYL